MRTLTQPGMIFDLDGTLLDSMYVWNEVDEIFLRRRGYDVPADYAQSIAHLSFSDAARYTIARFGLHETVDTIMAEWHALAVRAYRDDVPLKPGACAFLERQRQKGVRLAAATSSEEALFAPCLSRLGIADWFENVTTVREVARGKGFPDIYELAARRLGLPPADCAVFEDILKGVEGAKLGGFYTVGVFDPASEADRPAIEAAADLYITSWDDID